MIRFSEWRQDIYDLEGKLVGKDVLVLRATMNKNDLTVEFHALVWDEHEQEIEDTKEILKAACENLWASAK